jgi:hypothetical protein
MQNVYFQTEEFKGNELTVREGKALELKPPEKIELSGDIKTVRSFVEKRKGISEFTDSLQEIDPDRAVVTVDKDNLSIEIDLDPENFYSTVITGRLELNPELLKFGIDTGKKYTQTELIKLLRRSKRWFSDSATHESLLKAYMALDVKVTTDLKNDAPDNRGNRYNSFEKKITANIPEDFILNVPIFKGQDYKKFRVEIILDSTDGSTKFWFESVELEELISIESEAILKKELESCADYVVIWK